MTSFPGRSAHLAPTGQLQLLSTTLPVGYQLSLRPNGTKNTKRHRSGPFMPRVTSDSQHSFLARLPGHLQQGFCSVPSHTIEFANAPMGSTSIGHRLGKHLDAADLFAGESNHAFRRGQIQSMAAQGMSRLHIGEAVQIKTSSITDLYAEVTRHVPRLQRLGKRKHGLSCQ